MGCFAVHVLAVAVGFGHVVLEIAVGEVASGSAAEHE